MSRLRSLKFIVVVLCCVAGVWAIGQAQETGTPIAPPEESASPEEPAASHQKIYETLPAPSAFDRIDGIFKEAVSGIETILFHRLGKTPRTYVKYEHVVTYVRDQDSDTAFRRNGPIDPSIIPEGHAVQQDSLTLPQIQMLSVQGVLLPGHVVQGEQREYRLGTIGNRKIEYVQVTVPFELSPIGETARVLSQGDKFVYDDTEQLFRLVEPPRGVLSKTFVLTHGDVEELDAAGLLPHAATPEHADEPFLQSEQVGGIPLVVAWLALGAVFFTIYMRGFNLWGVRHAFDVVRGRFDNPKEAGEVTHFQALASALSGTIGLGNIAGVTIAMTTGGPGAFFWMLLCGFFGMTTKFVECSLAVKYRKVNADGHVLGGPMQYLKLGLAELKLPWLGTVLSFAFTIMCILASFGGGNMYQANQSGAAMLQMFQQTRLDELVQIKEEIQATATQGDAAKVEQLQATRRVKEQELRHFEEQFRLYFGVLLSVAVGVVIIGGIKRIGKAAEMLVPSMCLIYMAACLYIICSHLPQLPNLILSVFTEAFSGKAIGGGILGVLVIGVQRAAFSNEAGAGSAAIAHSAAKTEEPIREGCVALLEPFIDTIVVCSMTALVILITGAWNNAEWTVERGLAGSALTVQAFRAEISWFPYILGIAVTLFAYSTIISWSYYGERCWEMLFGPRSTGFYRVLTVACVFIGTIVNLGSVLDFSDMMILGMAFPNILGLVLLAPMVRKDLMNYWQRYRAGEFKPYK